MRRVARPLPVHLLSLALAACGAGEELPATGAPDAAPVDAAAVDADETAIGARVTVTQGARVQTYEWTAANGGHLECRPDGRRYFMRMAKSSANDGEDDLHVDIDVCGFDGPGSYPSADPLATPCESGRRFFDVFWHAGDGVFRNDAASAPCTLEVGGDAARLTIALRCDDLVRPVPSPDRVAVHADARCERR